MARVQNGRSWFCSCHSLRECIFFFCRMVPIRRYLPVVQRSCQHWTTKTVQSNLPRHAEKIFNVSTRISRFRRYSAWQLTKLFLFHQILQPEGDVFGIRHRLLNPAAQCMCLCESSRLTSMSTRHSRLDGTVPGVLAWERAGRRVIALFRKPWECEILPLADEHSYDCYQPAIGLLLSIVPRSGNRDN